nr:PKD domain-containing protein [Angustibacter aerolatus]
MASYAWDFGDGQTGTGATASHTYATAGTKTVTLTVTDDEGATGVVSKAVSVTAPNVAPTAAFTSSAANLALTVDGSTSSDTDGTISGWSWTFGDGGTATGTVANHTYAAAGTYSVKAHRGRRPGRHGVHHEVGHGHRAGERRPHGRVHQLDGQPEGRRRRHRFQRRRRHRRLLGLDLR